MFKKSKSQTCMALRPKDNPPHIGCLPGQCDSCFTHCGTSVPHGYYCAECFRRYLNHPNAQVRRSFLQRGLKDRTLTVEQLSAFVNDSSGEIASQAQYALDIGLLVPTDIFG